MTNNNIKNKIRIILPFLLLLITITVYSQYIISTIPANGSNSDGIIAITLGQGDAGPYDLLLEDPNNSTQSVSVARPVWQFSNKAAGIYILTIKDKIGCVYTESIELLSLDFSGDEDNCPVNINLIDIQHNSHQLSSLPDSRIEIEAGFNLDNFNVFWYDSEGNNIQQNQFSLEAIPAGLYSVSIEHKSIVGCKATKSFQIISCETTEYDIASGEVEHFDLGPDIRLEILDMIGPSTSSSADGEINYGLVSGGGETFINWDDLNDEAIVTDFGIKNIKEGTYCYTIENGCGDIQQDCIDVISCSTNVDLNGEILNIVSPQCLGMDYSVRFGIEYSNSTYEVGLVNITLSETATEETQMFVLQDEVFIDFTDLSISKAYNVQFEDSCGRVYEQNFTLQDEIGEYTSPCNSFDKGKCGNLITNGIISLYPECKSGDCSNTFDPVVLPFNLPNFGLNNAEIHLDTDFEKWNYCEVEITWPDAETTTTISRKSDGSYSISGPKSFNIDRIGRYEISININQGECIQSFTTDFDDYIILGRIDNDDYIWGSWAKRSSMDRDLIPQNPDSRDVCGKWERDTRFIFVPNDPLSGNPCQDGGYWYTYDFIEGKRINVGGIIEPNGFSTVDFISLDWDDFPDCNNSGNINACIFLDGSIPGIPNLPGQDVWMYYCDDPKEDAGPSCETVATENPPGLCTYDITCADGSSALLGGILLESEFRGSICWIESNVEYSYDYGGPLGDEIKYCPESCEIVEVEQSRKVLGENQILCKDLFPSCPPESFLNL